MSANIHCFQAGSTQAESYHRAARTATFKSDVSNFAVSSVAIALPLRSKCNSAPNCNGELKRLNQIQNSAGGSILGQVAQALIDICKRDRLEGPAAWFLIPNVNCTCWPINQQIISYVCNTTHVSSACTSTHATLNTVQGTF